MTTYDYDYYLDRVHEFRRALDIYQADEKLHAALYQEEAQELEESKTQQDTADALCDLLFVWMGWDIDCGRNLDASHNFFAMIKQRAMSADIHLPAAFELVHASNMSKICYGDTAPSVAQFDALQIEFTVKQLPAGGVAFYSAADQTGLDGKFYPEGKLLKPACFFEPRWDTNHWRAGLR